ncbi:MAG: hypothetical protein Q4A31_03125 [Corynebacterium sp.]|uniref:hypothetical protein n=1 Tax=Corynebacterium sp. TaxID=1720 RepID=UPI0026DB1814|nr:hypothetical protein [Corynebacterium sp.]MDO4760900.1 hypothetical protein [Corynebacterium sp.]
MTIVPLPDKNIARVNAMETHAIVDTPSFNELLQAFDTIAAQQKRFGTSYLTLEFLPQMLYTSGHAVDYNGFDRNFKATHEHDDDAYDLWCYHNAQKAFSDPAHVVAWDELHEGLPATDEDVATLARIYDNLDELCDPVHIVLAIPTHNPTDFLACLPNGYFSADLSPFHNVTIIERMTKKYGLKLLGMGASTLAFRRLPDCGLNVAGVVADMQHIYGNTASPHWAKVAEGIEKTGLVLLCYATFWE